MNYLDTILQVLRSGDLSVINDRCIKFINDLVMEELGKSVNDINDIINMEKIIIISNILYNNTDRAILPLEDGVYDLLLERYRKYSPSYQVGAEVVKFNQNDFEQYQEKPILINPILIVDEKKYEESLFIDDISRTPKPNKLDGLMTPFIEDQQLSKSFTDTKHVYPKLVGTLDKCKFVLNSQAMEKGVFEDDNVRVFERDFLQKHLAMGLLNMEKEFYVVAELKYDGLSVEAEVSDRVHSARSRGDMDTNEATDLTPILKNYLFRHAMGEVPMDNIFGMKFEAILTYENLQKISQIRGKEYKNPRNAIVGLFGSNDANLFRDYVTLIPLATSMDVDRLTEIEFLNKYYCNGELLRYSVLYGNYTSILFQVKRFVEEAEYMRSFLPFMYDGVVISYIEPNMIDALGRDNYVNKYSVAIKFNTLKKQTTFLGYSYTIGQNGTVTPIIHYNPVEFYGTIHTKASGHSYSRFIELGLRSGDIIEVEYVNDVIPYVSKPDTDHNRNNNNPLEEFPTFCPSCGSRLQSTGSGKSIICENILCPDRNISRITNMIDKLGFKEFSQETMKTLNITSLKQLVCLTYDQVKVLGEVNGQKLLDKISVFINTPMYDYRLMGSLGFTSLAIEKWRSILKNIKLIDILEMNIEDLAESLRTVRGIGDTSRNIIIREREIFKDDLEFIKSQLYKGMVISTFGSSDGKNIRFTGIRSDELVNLLNELGHNASDGAVTKDTDILIVPNRDYRSSKTSKLKPDGLIIPYDEFRINMKRYLE